MKDQRGQQLLEFHVREKIRSNTSCCGFNLEKTPATLLALPRRAPKRMTSVG